MKTLMVSILVGALVSSAPAFAKNGNGNSGSNRSECRHLPSHGELTEALKMMQTDDNGGFGFDMWGAVVNRHGVVCAVFRTGDGVGDQWPGSRAIAAQKANTANAFSLPDFALSTANIFSAVQPGGSLFGLQESNPVNVNTAYRGQAKHYGRHNDPMVGRKIGGVNVFGGGVPLYDSSGKLVGGLGVSGDSSCADHNIAWKTRWYLNLDNVPAGVSPDPDFDNIIYLDPGEDPNGFKHPECGNDERLIGENLPDTHPVGPEQ